MDKETAKYVICYIVGLVFGFVILSFLGLVTAAGILHAIAFLHKINM